MIVFSQVIRQGSCLLSHKNEYLHKLQIQLSDPLIIKSYTWFSAAMPYSRARESSILTNKKAQLACSLT